MGSSLVEGRLTEVEPADPDVNLEEPGLRIGMSYPVPSVGLEPTLGGF
jgi:hypothetical protein